MTDRGAQCTCDRATSTSTKQAQHVSETRNCVMQTQIMSHRTKKDVTMRTLWRHIRVTWFALCLCDTLEGISMFLMWLITVLLLAIISLVHRVPCSACARRCELGTFDVVKWVHSWSDAIIRWHLLSDFVTHDTIFFQLLNEMFVTTSNIDAHSC